MNTWEDKTPSNKRNNLISDEIIDIENGEIWGGRRREKNKVYKGEK